MYKTRNIMLVAIAVLLTITTSRGINFSDFEAPTYTAGSSLDGLDGWTIAVGTTNRGRVTPTFDADLGITITNVLEGSQSMYVKSAVHAGREWNGAEGFVQDGLEISWLMQANGFTRTEVYIATNVPGLNTPIGLKFETDGDVIRSTPGSGFVDTGLNYLTNKTYKMTMLVDFTAQTVEFTSQNITDGGAVSNLGTGTTGLIDTNGYQAGGLIFLERNGIHVFFDSIEVSNSNITQTIIFNSIVVADVVGMEFSSTNGITYSLEASTNLVVPDFQPTGATLEGDGQPLTFFDPTGFSTTKIYRIVSSP